MACKQVMKERQKRTATGPSQGLKALHDKLAKTYKYRSLHARLIELQLPLQGDSDNVVEIVVRVRVDAPKCPLCSKHVLELVVQETLQQELVAKHFMLRDAELVVVDKDYNILSASLPPASAGAQGEGVVSVATAVSGASQPNQPSPPPALQVRCDASCVRCDYPTTNLCRGGPRGPGKHPPPQPARGQDGKLLR